MTQVVIFIILQNDHLGQDTSACSKPFLCALKMQKKPPKPDEALAAFSDSQPQHSVNAAKGPDQLGPEGPGGRL
ncbi:hypothetical protein HMPREF0322_00908 [Desulfitobacterium hafniense DP7]|uniref:Uncharacterized protein n=2 Tax=Desulfitobacterium hafniense TaxID=49338 RepID=A0A0W1JDK6_DESHA|nr:hypothetical protein HMPREF0322_00908 [Desulfitobacterium hafniense DP7]KTE89582.1 hypothetical protein AT727_12165 [Desulfitobacterium hafniense]